MTQYYIFGDFYNYAKSSNKFESFDEWEQNDLKKVFDDAEWVCLYMIDMGGYGHRAGHGYSYKDGKYYYADLSGCSCTTVGDSYAKETTLENIKEQLWGEGIHDELWPKPTEDF